MKFTLDIQFFASKKGVSSTKTAVILPAED